jgi:hypothetical protein
MLTQEMRNKIREYWLEAFGKLERLSVHQIRQDFEPHEMVGLYAVASICYDDGNHSPVIDDSVFDRLCEAIDEHFDECVETGATYLDRELLKCHSGYDMTIFIQPYHTIAGVLLSHPCRCFKCSGALDRESAA